MSTPPSPGEFAQQLAEQYATPDPDNPFNNRTETAKQHLVLSAVYEVFGENEPIAQFCKAYSRAERISFPVRWAEDRGTMLETQIENMRTAWEEIEQEYTHIMDQMNGEV